MNHRQEVTMLRSGAHITAIGTYVPDRVLTNDDLERMVDTNDEWIVQRTGMKERRIADTDQYTSDLCIAALEDMQTRYNVKLEDADGIIVCTTTPDYAFPNVASQVQAKFGIRQAAAFDLSAACAGFVYGLHIANALITTGLHRKIIVIGAETMSKVTDYTDRTTCILFGDGAGAVLVEQTNEKDAFLASYVDTDGRGGVHVYRTALSSTLEDMPLQGEGRVVQNGREVYKWAVTSVPQGMKELLHTSGLQLEDIDWFIPHSANLRMIESICERSGFPIEKTLYSLVYYGNTSSASIPLSIELGLREGKLQSGDVLLLYGFGAGLVQAGMVLQWTLDTTPITS